MAPKRPPFKPAKGQKPSIRAAAIGGTSLTPPEPSTPDLPASVHAKAQAYPSGMAGLGAKPSTGEPTTVAERSLPGAVGKKPSKPAASAMMTAPEPKATAIPARKRVEEARESARFDKVEAPASKRLDEAPRAPPADPVPFASVEGPVAAAPTAAPALSGSGSGTPTHSAAPVVQKSDQAAGPSGGTETTKPINPPVEVPRDRTSPVDDAAMTLAQSGAPPAPVGLPPAVEPVSASTMTEPVEAPMPLEGTIPMAIPADIPTAADAPWPLGSSLQAAASGLGAINRKAMEALCTNAGLTLDLWKSLVGVRSVAEAVLVHTEHARHQFEVMTRQARDLQALTRKMASEATKSLEPAPAPARSGEPAPTPRPA